MARPRTLAVIVIVGLAACGGAWFYRSSWHPKIAGKWFGAYSEREAARAPSDANKYVMPIQFREDGTFTDYSTMSAGNWKDTSGSLSLDTTEFYGLTHQQAIAKWTKPKKGMSGATGKFLENAFRPRTLRYDGQHMVEIELGGQAAIWYRRD